MKTTTSQKARIGIFTGAGLLLLVIGIFLIGKKKNMFGDTYNIYGNFKNVGGLQVGNNIRFAGINVGTVENISIVSDTLIRVDMTLQSKIKPFLKSNSFASIGSDGLMGDKLITIAAGVNNRVLLPNGGRIRTVDPVDFDRIIARLTNVAANAEVISGELAGMAVQIRQGNGTISRLLYNDDLAKGLEGTVNNAQKITGSLAGIATDIRSGNGSVGRLIYNDSLAKSLESTAVNAKAAMTTIQEAADGFSENMKALHGNIFLKGYFKRKAAQKQEKAESGEPEVEMTEDDIREIEAAAEKAQKEIEARKLKEKAG